MKSVHALDTALSAFDEQISGLITFLDAELLPAPEGPLECVPGLRQALVHKRRKLTRTAIKETLAAIETLERACISSRSPELQDTRDRVALLLLHVTEIKGMLFGAAQSLEHVEELLRALEQMRIHREEIGV